MTKKEIKEIFIKIKLRYENGDPAICFVIDRIWQDLKMDKILNPIMTDTKFKVSIFDKIIKNKIKGDWIEEFAWESVKRGAVICNIYFDKLAKKKASYFKSKLDTCATVFTKRYGRLFRRWRNFVVNLVNVKKFCGEDFTNKFRENCLGFNSSQRYQWLRENHIQYIEYVKVKYPKKLFSKEGEYANN